MQIIELSLDHYNFYCPVTGVWIANEEDVNDDAPSLLGYWLDEFWDEPFIKDDRLLQEWTKYMDNFEALQNSEEFVNVFRLLEDFFSNLNLENVVVFKKADNVPFSLTPYFVIDMNTHESL